MIGKKAVTIQLVFVDQGSYRIEEVKTTSNLIEKYDRLIDFLQEEPEFLAQVHVDLDRLCMARVAGD